MNENLKRLSDAGVSIWLDDISRERLRSGNLSALIRDKNVTGVTSNPTIFASALSKGDAYDAQMRDLATRGVTVEEAVRAITTFDIRWAADVLRPVFDATRGVDGRVSIEVDPRMARRTEATIAEARALWWLVDRPNVHIKIPATVEGLPAITQAISEGISVNVTLIFSLERYRQVIDAWLSGLEKAKANGLDLATIESVASFFVSRVDTEIDSRLDKIGTPEAAELKGRAAVANARLAYAAYEEVMNSPRWQALRAAGAHPQRPLWASTGVKNPDFPDTLYVEQLVTAGVVNTMPEKTLDASADHGRISGDTIRPFYQQAWDVMASLKQAGIDYDDVVRALEEEGLEKFETSWGELLETVDGELRKA
ncbi:MULTISPECIES: transaldolase [Microbispora]|uniref:Transaldolase n=3 Tax=Microbispora TaxID=2005 RepID=A0ABY3LWZ4_9ACTN|nr:MULTISPECIES: transaldolase [Microbispora]RGA05413.1 transaldolase [Microbispora triticiradicis]TLP59864.1 transaldolase [Microbispora fusca]TYB58224.1 transaldolase [Microbispora tritici]GLW23340.1 transaldolase [Microbispora amethystogenes]